jgi:predicted SprT family Zn-dependent metalloprotease
MKGVQLMPEVTVEWLEKQAKQLVKKYWNIKHIPNIVIDSDREADWTNVVGYYWSDTQTIEFKNEINKNRTLREIKRTLLHELCHWYLHTTGQRWRDSDERFARELIRVGLGRRHNKDEQAQLAAKQAWERKKKEFFEIYEVNDETILVSRMSHHRKDQNDFKKDLAQTLIKIHNSREEDDLIYPTDVAEKMSEWYGYKIEPLAVYGINLSANSYTPDIGSNEDIRWLLINRLDVDPEVIEKKLKYVASEE